MINISQPLLVHLSEKEQRESQEDGGKAKKTEGKREGRNGKDERERGKASVSAEFGGTSR